MIRYTVTLTCRCGACHDSSGDSVGLALRLARYAGWWVNERNGEACCPFHEPKTAVGSGAGEHISQQPKAKTLPVGRRHFSSRDE